MGVSRASPSAQVNLGMLRRLGVPESDVSTLRDAIHGGNDLDIDVYGRVALGTIDRFAQRLSIDVPTDTIASLLTPSTAPTLQLPKNLAGYPDPQISFTEPREYGESMAPAQVDARSLRASGSALQAFLTTCHDRKWVDAPIDLSAGVDAQKLANLIEQHRPTARQHLTPEQIEASLTAVYSARGPAYVEQDAVVNLDAHFDLLTAGEGAAAGVNIHKKSTWEHLFVSREGDGKSWNLQGFRGEKVVVSLPRGFSVLMIDGRGDQRGFRLPARKMDVDGQMANAVEIDLSMVRAGGTDFTLKVLDASNKPVMDEHIGFNPQLGRKSQRLAEGTFVYPDKPETRQGELSDQHFNHFVPDASANAAPAGERPRFSIGDGPACDQISIQRDGKTFSVNRWCQFISPPKARTQVCKVKGGVVKLLPRGSETNKLDHSEYSPITGAHIQGSHGGRATFDRGLDQTRQARWDFRGMHVLDPTLSKSLLSFNPLKAR